MGFKVGGHEMGRREKTRNNGKAFAVGEARGGTEPGVRVVMVAPNAGHVCCVCWTERREATLLSPLPPSRIHVWVDLHNVVLVKKKFFLFASSLAQ